jgi:4'-phosphopantetheinyl transferase
MTENTIWLPAAAGLQLGSNEVHVWRASLDVDSAVQERLSVLLSRAERERAARFAFTRDRNRFIVARAILRQLLGGYLREPSQGVVLETLAHGKPILAATSRIPGLRFNLSHSHRFALFAFCLQREVGIDLEEIKPQVVFEGIESRYFSPDERAELETLHPDLRPEGFFLCWTRKEAYLKATGEGLKVPLESFSVSLTPGKPAVLRSSDEQRWSVYSIPPPTGFAAALVAEGRGHQLRLWEWTGADPS